MWQGRHSLSVLMSLPSYGGLDLVSIYFEVTISTGGGRAMVATQVVFTLH